MSPIRIFEITNRDEDDLPWFNETKFLPVPLIEKNAELLARLEEEWSSLEPLRQIEFNVRFVSLDYDPTPPDLSAESFAARAKEEGCECTMSSDQYGTWYVTASKMMEPKAADISILQERLKSFVDEHPGGYLDGWNYPPKKAVRFWPNCPGSDKSAAFDRAAVLFESEQVEDPLKGTKFFRSVEQKTNRKSGTPFKLVPSEFLRRAQASVPKCPEPTASAFSQWVYSLYSQAQGDEEDLERGKDAEREIWVRRRAAQSCNDNRFLRSIRSPWSLVHNGLHLDRQRSPDYFELPTLRVNGAPLRASPDLVYVNQENSEVIIVEIKHSHLPITKNLWPNLWAQLWCYSHIDVAASAPKVTVVGEVWGEMWSRGYGQGRSRVEGKKLVCLRASVRRNPRARAYDRFFRALFEIYRGS